MVSIPVDAVMVGTRHRKLRPDHVKVLAGSIADAGLLQPIVVVREDAGLGRDAFGLVAGLHRLEACRSLGLAEIEATIAEMSDLQRELGEIDENLCRADLTELERSEHLARRKDVYIGLHPETRQHGNIGPDRQFVATETVSFASNTATLTGRDERSIQRDVRRAEKICAKAKDLIRGTDAEDSGVELDALAAMAPDDQVKAARMVADGRADSIRAAKVAMRPAKPVALAADPYNDLEAVEKQVSGLMAAWNRAGPEAREKFLEMIDRPVFDSSRAA